MNNARPQQRAATRWRPSLLLDLAGSPDLPTAASAMSQAGVPVFPCVAGGKQPLTTRGFHDATAEAGQVTAWWRRWPDANLGMPTGGVSGVDVVDVDVHPHGSGFPAFERARTAGYVEGWAWLVRTPSAGVHAHFLRSGPVEQRSWQVPDQHVDFRGDGGYIILPPSRVATADGTVRSYELIALAQHQPQPVDAAGLRAFLDPPRPVRGRSSVPVVGARPDTLAAWVASRPEGARNHGLFWAACRMAEEGHRFDAAASLLDAAARSAGLTERESLTTIRSAYRNATRPAPVSTACPSTAVEAVGP